MTRKQRGRIKMLQIEKIHKKYITGDLVQTALNDVSLNLRDNELVAILGPSGSGKTTLLNIIGGLDHYDSGDLIINGISNFFRTWILTAPSISTLTYKKTSLHQKSILKLKKFFYFIS